MGVKFAIGECRSVVQFQRNTPVDNQSGGQDDAWNTFITTRGRLRKKTGRKDIERGTVQFDKEYELVCRYQSDILINADTRILVDGIPYRINDWEAQNEIHHILIFSLSRTDE